MYVWDDEAGMSLGHARATSAIQQSTEQMSPLALQPVTMNNVTYIKTVYKLYGVSQERPTRKKITLRFLNYFYYCIIDLWVSFAM